MSAIRDALENMATDYSDAEVKIQKDAIAEHDALRHAARVLTRPMDFTTDEYVKASALLKALAEEAT